MGRRAEDLGGESAESSWLEALGLGAEEQAGGGLLLLCDFEGVQVVGGGEKERGCGGAGGERGGGVWEQAEVAEGPAGDGGVGGVRGGDEDVSMAGGEVGEGESEMGEHGFERRRRKRSEADEQAGGRRRFGEVARRCSGLNGGFDVAGSGGHCDDLSYLDIRCLGMFGGDQPVSRAGSISTASMGCVAAWAAAWSLTKGGSCGASVAGWSSSQKKE